MHKWNFPSNGNGRFDGFNDAAIDHFTDDRLGSFIREAIQNSLDACLDETNPVKVSFRLDPLSKTSAPEIMDLAPWLNLAMTSAREGDAPDSTANYKEVAYFSKVISDLRRAKNIPVLSVHDSNTRGLSGPLGGPRGSWFALTKGTGVNEKHSAGSLGSFGHGSKAPFAMTKLRTVFYFTRLPASDNLNPTQERFQGKSILRSMVLPDGSYTSGTGFFGTGDSCQPIVGDSVPSWIRDLRTASGFEAGTTLSIPVPTMFHDLETWNEATIAVLASFYYAIKKGALEVCLQDLEINAKNLAEVFDGHIEYLHELKHLDADGIRSRMYSVETIHSPTESGVLNSPTFGNVDYFVRTGPEIQWKKVGIARKSGMLITRDAENYKRFSNNTNFDLFICVGEEPGNNILRSMENPRHDSFSLDRIEDEDERKRVKKAYNTFSEQVKELLAELAPLIVEQTSIIDDLDDLLKLPDSDENLASEGDEASTKAKISGIRTTHPTRMLRPTKGKDTGRKPRKPGGKVKRLWWHGSLTSSWSEVSQAQSLRVVPQTGSSRLVSVFLTVPIPGKYCLELYRAGESENQFIRVDKPSSVSFEVKEPNQRVELKPQLDPKDLAFAIEGLIHVVSE
jgi:hypothetical protein